MVVLIIFRYPADGHQCNNAVYWRIGGVKNNKQICITPVCRLTSEALDGQLQWCFTVRNRPKCLTENKSAWTVEQSYEEHECTVDLRNYGSSPLCRFAPWLIRPLALFPLACSPLGSFASWLVCPLADSPHAWLIHSLTDSPPVEYTCDSLLRQVFVFQFTERQQVSNRQMTVDNHFNSSTVT